MAAPQSLTPAMPSMDRNRCAPMAVARARTATARRPAADPANDVAAPTSTGPATKPSWPTAPTAAMAAAGRSPTPLRASSNGTTSAAATAAAGGARQGEEGRGSTGGWRKPEAGDRHPRGGALEHRAGGEHRARDAEGPGATPTR